MLFAVEQRSSQRDQARKIHSDKHTIFSPIGPRYRSRISEDRSVESNQKRPGQPFPERVASNTLDPPVDIGIETKVQRPLSPDRASAVKYMTLRKFCESRHEKLA
jgi:hypothetical protein